MMKIDSTHRLVDLDPRDTQFYQNPYPTYRRLHAECPIFKWEQYGHWCFSRHEDVNNLLRDRRFGRQILHMATREELGWAEPPQHIKVFTDHEQHSLLELEPPVHTRLRGLISRAFLSRQIERLRPVITDMANTLVDGFADQQEVDVLAAFATPVPVLVICDLLGAPPEMADQFLAWSHDHVAMYMAKRDRAIEDRAVAAVSAFSDYMRQLIAARRKNLGSDLLSELIRAESEGQKLTEDELVTTAILVLNAGHEATVHSLGNGLKAMLERGITGPVTPELVDEILRFDPPLHMFTRYALDDIEYEGITLKKGETVGLMLGAANHDAAKFSNPEQFDVTRTPNAHVAFGAGIHFCIGAPLARLEMQVALEVLCARFPKMSLAEQPHYKDVYHFHGLEALRVKLR
ncbi:cytochrome P450 [Aestuariivirga litoralis]|uniref:cytochrome P450 n=1 Tax=Aestuariivirga litoralis TaxID=2650924 RepID=UPI0018C84F62|nr:cytochrome P450 [Aestuariivirga litoralis]MBG1232261.1 cytochrome P450 [Aestuariivirga litoralis]